MKKLKTAYLVNLIPSMIGLGNFLPVRALVIGLIVVWGLGVTGCKSLQPVSSTTVTTDKKDSTTTETQTKKDSTGYVEKMVERTLPATSIEKNYTKQQLDSIINGLRQLPQGQRMVFVTDPKFHATLKIYLDSIGKLHFKCTSEAQTYFEKDVEKTRYIQSLNNELTKVNEQNKTLVTQVKQYQKTWWQKIEDAFKDWLLRVLLFIIAVGFLMMIIQFGWKKIKAFL